MQCTTQFEPAWGEGDRAASRVVVVICGAFTPIVQLCLPLAACWGLALLL
jgi:hypothetical protein